MGYEPWMLAAMEEHGYMTSSTGLINRVAYHLANSTNPVIGIEEFCEACYACNVDPSSFTQDDLEQLERMLNQIVQ